MDTGKEKPRLIPSAESDILLPQQLSVWALLKSVDDYFRLLGGSVKRTASAGAGDFIVSGNGDIHAAGCCRQRQQLHRISCLRLPGLWRQRQHQHRRRQRRNLWCRQG